MIDIHITYKGWLLKAAMEVGMGRFISPPGEDRKSHTKFIQNQSYDITP